MEDILLHLKPEYFLCPYCGKWHQRTLYPLGYYGNSFFWEVTLKCKYIPSNSIEGVFRFYFENDYFHYSILPKCGKIKLIDSIDISSFILGITNLNEVVATVNIPFQLPHDIGNTQCSTCDAKHYCNFLCLANADNSRKKEITLGFIFDNLDKLDFPKFIKEKLLSLTNHESSKIKSDSQITQLKFKEDTTMANNTFNMNLKFGLNKDPNIASTLMGIAVKNGSSWRIYDKEKKEIIDVGTMSLGNFPIFIMPTTKLNAGDLIMDSGEYYFVIKVEEGCTETLCARTGEMKKLVPIKNVLGFNCYSKIVALRDSINLENQLDTEKLLIISALGEESSEINNQTKQILPFLLLKDKFSGDDDIMKIMFMSSMMSGNTAGNNSLVMSYMMLDMFMNKKKKEQTSIQDSDK